MLRQGRFKSARVAASACAILLAGCDAWLTKPSLYNTVDVVVAQRDGTPIPGTNLILYTGDRPMGYAVTGLDGRFTFKRVPQGVYGVLATPPSGYDVFDTFVHDGLLVADDTLLTVHFTFLKIGAGVTAVIRPVLSQGVRGPWSSIKVECPFPQPLAEAQPATPKRAETRTPVRLVFDRTR